MVKITHLGLSTKNKSKILLHTMKSIGILICFIFQTMLFAQQGSIRGNIKDETNTGVEFANVLLYTADSVYVKAALTDEAGNFTIDQLQTGNYYLKVSHLVYTSYLSPIIDVDSRPIILEPIILTSNVKKLAEVTIQAKKPFIERQLDKLVVNVEQSILAAGSSLLEVLERSPGVIVNQESSLNLKGKSGVIVMFDGKPTPLSGADLITYLKTIPSSNIQNIEIITNPSARYDAAGNAGIINIRFKKDQRQGLNGGLTLSYGQGVYPKPNASINFNYRKKNINFFGSYAHARPTQLTRFFIHRNFFDELRNPKAAFDQTSFVKQPIVSNTTRLGLDYYIGKKTIIGALVSGNWSKQMRDGNTNTIVSTANNEIDYTTQTSITMDDQRQNGFANINFKHQLNDKGKEVTADIDYGEYTAATLQDISNINKYANGSLLSSDLLNTNQNGNITVQSIKADFVNPINKTSKWEAGIKLSQVKSDNDVKFFNILQGSSLLDPGRSNHFVYDENVSAAYTSYAKEFKKIDIQAGLRMEHTNTHGTQLATNESFSRNYINWFPNIVFNLKPSDKNQYTVSFAKRIDRPSYRQLNPFRLFVDTYTYVVGDPKLKPVITYNYELNHTFKSKYVTTLTYTRSREVITDIFVQDDATKISYQIPANLQNFDQFNIGLYIPVTTKKWLNSTITANGYWNKYDSPLQGGNLVNEYSSWDIRVANAINLGKSWNAEVNGFYQAQNAWGLFIIKDLAQVSLGIAKTSKDRNTTFKFALSDIFLTNHIAVEVDYQNMDFYTDRTWDSRVATLSITTRFGKNTVTRARQRNTGVEEEKRRANG